MRRYGSKLIADFLRVGEIGWQGVEGPDPFELGNSIEENVLEPIQVSGSRVGL
jgi:hypothetical protein